LQSITVQCPAKINLGLEIVRTRPDGYHDIKTIFQKVTLFDTIELKRLPEKKITLTVNDNSIPSDSKNLAYKAAACILDDCDISAGVSITLKKRIPAGAGLGGGSSNAAGTLLGITQLFNLCYTQQKLHRFALSLGADVPFFVSPHNTASASGVGDKLNFIPLYKTLWFIIVFPNFTISTSWAYSTLDEYKLLTKQNKHISIPDSIVDFHCVESLLHNDFEYITTNTFPLIKEIKDSLLKAGAIGTLLSGSGSAVYGLFKSQRACKEALAVLSTCNHYKYFIVHSL